MGGFTKIALPVLGLGALGAATGGFGLLGEAGALAGAEGAVAAGEGLTFTTAAEGALAPELLAAPMAAEPMGLAAALDGAMTVPVADLGAADLAVGEGVGGGFGGLYGPDTWEGVTQAALDGLPSNPFSFGDIIGKNGLLTWGQAGGLGVVGATGMVNARSSAADATAQQELLDVQMKQIRLTEADREYRSQQRLAQTLAGQTVAFLGRGQEAGSGSARSLTEAALSAADMEANLADASAAGQEWGYGVKSAALTRRRASSWTAPLFDVAGAAAGLGRTKSLLGLW